MYTETRNQFEYVTFSNTNIIELNYVMYNTFVMHFHNQSDRNIKLSLNCLPGSARKAPSVPQTVDEIETIGCTLEQGGVECI